MSKHENRAYQEEVEEAVFDHLFEHQGNGIVASPGGTGKSYMMAKLVKRLVQDWPGTRVMVLAKDAKLLDQNCNELMSLWPTAPCGIYSAGLKQRDTDSAIIFGGIQSVAKRWSEFGEFNIVLVDECDQISPAEETQYQAFIHHLTQVNPNLRVIGFTATPYRLGTGCLTNLDLWDRIIIDLTKTERFNWFVDNGFLAPLTTKKTAQEMDISKISMRGGEFDDRSMQEVADTDGLNIAVVNECIKYGADRKHWLVFSSGIDHGHKLAKLFNAKGVTTVMLSGKDSENYRREQEQKFKDGEVRCLINCGLYGRGWNFPALDLIAWVRATQSVSLWVQGCVRGTRTAPGKENALVLDFAGNIRRLGPVDDPIVPAPRRKGDGEGGEAPVKECPECHSYLHTRVMVCPDCGYKFPPPSSITKNSSNDAILRGRKDEYTGPQIEEFEVMSIHYRRKVSKNGNPYMKVSYSTGIKSFHRCVLFESPNVRLQQKALSWWKHNGGHLPIPATAEEACERAHVELTVPSIVRVDINKKYPDVVGTEVVKENASDNQPT